MKRHKLVCLLLSELGTSLLSGEVLEMKVSQSSVRNRPQEEEAQSHHLFMVMEIWDYNGRIDD